MIRAALTLVGVLMILMAVPQGTASAADPGDTWMSVAPLPQPRWDHAAVRGPDGRIYVIGGNNGFGNIASVDAYTPSTNTWTGAAPMPSPRNGLAVVRGPDGRIYAIGGHLTNSVVAYDPTTNTWSNVASMPTYVGVDICAAVGPNGRIYVVGNDSSMDVYNLSTNTWTTLFPTASNFPPRRGCAAVTGLDGRIYIIGGTVDGSVSHDIVEAYDVASNTRVTVAPMLTRRAGLAAVLGPDGSIYAFGGGGGATVTTAVEAYETTTNKWTAKTPMPTPRYFFAAATGADGRIYAIGGLQTTSGGVLNSVDAYNPLPPTTTTMDLTLSAPTTLPVVAGDYAPNPFEVVATVTNTGAIAAKDVALVLYLPAGLSLAAGSATQVIGDLPVGQQAQFTWNVRADGQKQDTTLTFFASALASNAEAKNTPRQITLPNGALTLKSIATNVGGDIGVVTATIHGGGFQDGAMAKLFRANQPEILGTRVSVASEGFTLTATFDLRKKARGLWSVAVTNPDSTEAILTDGFLVTEGRSPELWVDIVGRPLIRSGTPTRFFVVYGNQGNVDAFDSLFTVRLPKGLQARIDVEQPNVSGIQWSQVPQGSAGLGAYYKNIPLWVYSIPVLVRNLAHRLLTERRLVDRFRCSRSPV